MIDTAKKIKIAPEDYLEFEKNSEFKHEYLDGELFAMVRASKNHNWINSNIVRELGNHLKETSCMVFASDMRVKAVTQSRFSSPYDDFRTPLYMQNSHSNPFPQRYRNF
ncbi:hypothetical protein MTBBW1_1860022 [Desulfamplus magnetovallimortis]|uniref:Putative restriction endonuclease domain-containing protein n=1 Tax=Desulfamplus magnetovallimortis TaxID=1246637 RepID=A0A1W1HAU0_9BACT|nr:hypothetical protein MTBBW1_1860022 [Desulfamplus magnetovallimortis]